MRLKSKRRLNIIAGQFIQTLSYIDLDKNIFSRDNKQYRFYSIVPVICGYTFQFVFV